MTSSIEYQGNLRTVCIHLQSNNQIITDAPTDNHGKGEAFSPTDLVATALGTCMVTVMGIKANSIGIELEGTTAMVNKVMASNPRRIAKVEITITFPQNKWDDATKNALEKTALHCPVAKSLHPDLEQVVEFEFNHH